MIKEEYAENRYLALFYEHLKKHGEVYNPYCYPSQMFFLKCKPLRTSGITDPSKLYIHDRGILEDRFIFVQQQIEMGLMSQEEIADYDKQYDEVLKQSFVEPEVLVYLKADVGIMQERVKKRARDMESDLVANSYLEALQKLYDNNLMPYIKENWKNTIILTYDTNKMGEEDVAGQILKD